MSSDQKTDYRWVGKNTIRPDEAEKVMGKANFGADIQMPKVLDAIDAPRQQAAE